MSFQAEDGRASANCFTETGGCVGLRCRRLGVAPRPGFRGGAGRGCFPGSHTLVIVSTPPIYCKRSWVGGAELRVEPIHGIGQHYAHRDLLLESLPNLLQRNFRLGLKFQFFGHAGLARMTPAWPVWSE